MPYICPEMQPEADHSYKIMGFTDLDLGARLISIGIYPGKIIEIKREAWMGGAYYVSVDGIHYALREQEMNKILLEPFSKNPAA